MTNYSQTITKSIFLSLKIVSLKVTTSSSNNFMLDYKQGKNFLLLPEQTEVTSDTVIRQGLGSHY